MLKNELLLEACVETFEQAVLAQNLGARRIELCAHLEVGGLTPPEALIRQVLQALEIPVMVIIRPVAGGFVYSKAEFDQMKKEIEFCKGAGAAGVVLGILTNSNEIDTGRTRELVELAQPLLVTFHKAIDETPDPVQASRLLKEIPGIQRILSSGAAETALEGKKVLKQMMAACEPAIKILVAGKVTKENLAVVHREIGAKEYHGRRIVF